MKKTKLLIVLGLGLSLLLAGCGSSDGAAASNANSAGDTKPTESTGKGAASGAPVQAPEGSPNPPGG